MPNVVPFPKKPAWLKGYLGVNKVRRFLQSWVDTEYKTGGGHMSAHCSDCVISKSLNGTIVSWNPGAERLYGYTSTEAIGRPFAMLVPKDKRAELAEMDRKLKAGEEILATATVRVTKGGKRVGVIIAMSPIIDETGTVVGAHGIGRPIAQQEQEKKTLEAKDTFAYGYLMAQLETIYEAGANAVKLASNFPEATEYFVQQIRAGMREANNGQAQIMGVTSLLCDLLSEAVDEQRGGRESSERVVQ